MGFDARAHGATRQHFRQRSGEGLRQSGLASFGASGKSSSADESWRAGEFVGPAAQRAFNRNAASVDPSGGNDGRGIHSTALKGHRESGWDFENGVPENRPPDSKVWRTRPTRLSPPVRELNLAGLFLSISFLDA